MTAEIDALPLSQAQRRLWLVQQLDRSSAAYNLPLVFSLRGGLEPARLRRALEAVVERHEALRTTFEVFESEPIQVFHPKVEVPWETIDLSDRDEDERRAKALRFQEDEAARGFDLGNGPLLRSRLLRLAEEEHLWLLTFHHIVFDGWSQEVLLDEIERFYRDLPDPLPELPIQYADFAVWQDEELTDERRERLLDFWRRELEGYPTVLRLPTDHPRPPRQTFRGALERLELPLETWEGVQALAERERATPHAVFLAAWMVVLHRLTGSERLLVGSPSAGRLHPDAEGLIGNFVNTLAVRGDLSGDPDFVTLLGRVGEASVAAMAHEDLMFELLVEALAPERHASFSPLIQVSMALESFNLGERELGQGLTIAPQPGVVRSSKVDLTLFVRRHAAGVRLVLEHNTDLFEAVTVRRWLGYLARVLAGALADPGRPVADLPILDRDERRLLLEEWPSPEDAADGPGAKHAERWETGLPSAFAAQVERGPEAIAVEAEGVSLSYRGLDRRSAALARRLAERGVRRGTPVALVLDRSPELIVAVLAIVRAGGAYVPLDADYPRERLALMVEEVGARLLVTRTTLAPRVSGLAGVTVLDVENEASAGGEASEAGPLDATGPDDLAYVIFTSGSTGRPKGVAAVHRGVARLALGADYTELGAEEACLHLASISFDAATLEVWGPLLTGGRVVLFPAEIPSPAAVRAAVARHRVSRLFLTTALFDQLAEKPDAIPDGLLHLMTGGEQASIASFRAVLAARPGLALSNVYGPTENTTFSTHHPVPGPEAADGPLPIGRSIAGSTCWVVDRRLRPAPIGVEGELLVGGDGLARGYGSRPASTADRFLPHPFSRRPGERLYRTGDLVRWRPPGVLEFVGRNDFQVKIRGFRIEPGEVEAALGAAPGVEKAVVVVRRLAGDPSLIGYYVPTDEGGVELEALREHLRRRLPPFMIPAALVPLDAFPLGPQGKVDRAALPEPDREAKADGADFVAPRTPLEEEIAALWTEVLGVERVGIHDDFFSLGGHSLLATRILARLGDDFGVEIPLGDLFEAPTVAGLATSLGALLLAEED